MLKWSCAQRKRRQNIDLLPQGARRSSCKESFFDYRKSHPLKQLVFRMVTSLFCIQRESNCVEKERASRELNFLSWLGSKTQSTSWSPQGEQLKLSLSREGKSSSKGVLRGLFLVKYDSLPKLFLLLFTFSMKKLIFLTKIVLTAARAISPQATL